MPKAMNAPLHVGYTATRRYGSGVFAGLYGRSSGAFATDPG